MDQDNRIAVFDEWNYELNRDLKPSDVSLGSNKKVWWTCSVCGHTWQATVKNRVNGSGCPNCKKYSHTSFPEQALFYYIRSIFNDAENSYRELFSNRMELDIFIPSINVGIEYDGHVWHDSESQAFRAQRKYEICKEKGVKLIRVAENEIESQFEIADHFVVRKALTNQSLNEAIIETLGIISSASVDVDTERDRLIILKQYIGVIKEKSIAYQFPELIQFWDVEKNNGITPEMVNCTSNRKYWWRCDLGHSFQAAPLNMGTSIQTGSKGCAICSGRKCLPGFNDLKTFYPQIAEEWDYAKNKPITPDEIMPGSQKKYWWICPNGHHYLSTPNSRTANGTGCPVCAGKQIVKGINDLATLRPDVAAFWDKESNDRSPEDVSPGSVISVSWKCERGHRWKKRIASQVAFNFCPYCEDRKIVSGENDFVILYPDIAIDWDYEQNEIDPRTISGKYPDYVNWKCHICGATWKQKVGVRVRTKCGCPKCGYSKKMQDTLTRHLKESGRDFQTLFPEIALEWDREKNLPLTPDSISPGAKKKIWWICPNGHSYQSWIGDRTGKHHTGCPYCAKKRKL